MSELSRFLTFIAVTVAVLLAVAVAVPRLLGTAAGPEVEIITRLKRVEAAGFSVPAAGGTLHAHHARYQRLSVDVASGEDRAQVNATLDFVGNLQRPGTPERTEVSSVGVEVVELAQRDGEWELERGPAPRLVEILELLESRRRSLERDGGQHLARAWFIRSERGEVQVAEDYRAMVDTPAGPSDVKATARLTLVADGGVLAFTR